MESKEVMEEFENLLAEKLYRIIESKTTERRNQVAAMASGHKPKNQNSEQTNSGK